MTDASANSIPVHASLSAPIMIAGIPRSVAIVNATCGAALCFGLQAPWFGIPVCALIHAISYWITSRDAYAFQTIRRHLLYPSHLDG